MQAAMLRPLSIKEYLDGEEHAGIRHEYVAGQESRGGSALPGNGLYEVHVGVDLPQGEATA